MEISCKWKPIDEYILADSGEKKEGRYHGSMFWNIKGFGSKRWVVAGYLDVPDCQQYLDEGISEREMVECCLAHLNQPPPRRKFQRKQPNSLYGHLEYYKHKITPDGIEVLVITNERKNSRFWSEGTAIS
jgi:hypothetical protein